jgi:hypothetical protein
MTIDSIREKLAIKIASSQEWIDKLNDTNPGHYGVEDWDVIVMSDNIWVDIPNKTFTFKQVQFDFQVMIGSSNSEDGLAMSFSRIAKGEGVFRFSANGNDVELEEMDVDFDLDLFGDD